MDNFQSFILDQLKSVAPDSILQLAKDDDAMWAEVCRQAAVNPESSDVKHVRNQI